MSFRLWLGRDYPRWRRLGLLGAVLWAVAVPASAQEGAYAAPAPSIAALSAVLMNPASGEVIYAKEPRLRLPPASTTKVLTALVALERLDLNARVPVSPQAASAPPSRIGLRPGEMAMTQDLLYGLMLKSGNDAAETLAEAAGGSVPGFAELMNVKAAQIGARESHFMNPHGLPNDDHYTTAYDLALIFRQAMLHPVFADIVRTRSADLRIESGRGGYGDWRMVPVQTHNRLLMSYDGTLGGKTGFTFKARRCFVGEVDRGGVRLIVAILNSPSSVTLWQDARKLLDYGFARYGLAPAPAVPIPAAPAADDDEPVMVQRTHAPAVARMTPAVAVRAPVSAKPTPVVAQASAKSKAAPVAVAAAKAPAKGKAAPVAVAAAKAPAKGKAAPVAVAAAKAPVVVARADKTVDKRAPTKISRAEVSSAKPGKPVKRRT